MQYKLKSETSGSILLGSLAAFLVELIWTMLSCFASAVFVEKGMISDEQINLMSAGVILAGSMLGAFTTIYFAKNDQPWLAAGISAGLYFVQLLMMNMMFFRIGMNGVWVTTLLIAGGATASALLNTCKNRRASSFTGKAKLGKLYKFNR